MDLSNKRVRKNGREGRIVNGVSIGVAWDNGSINMEKLDSLEFIEGGSVKDGYIIPKTTA